MNKQIDEIARTCPYNVRGRCGLDETICTTDCEVAKWGYEKASNVAREIFEEIERLLSANMSGEFRGDSVEWFDYFDLHLAEDIAELKKKYESEGEE